MNTPSLFNVFQQCGAAATTSIVCERTFRNAGQFERGKKETMTVGELPCNQPVSASTSNSLSFHCTVNQLNRIH